MGLRREEQFGEDMDREGSAFALLDANGDPHSGDSESLMIDEGYGLRSSAWVMAGRFALIAAAVGWFGFSAYLLVQRGFRLPAPEQIPLAAASMAAPLILIGILYLILARSSMGEADRFARITAQLRKEADALDMRLAIVNQQLESQLRTGQPPSIGQRYALGCKPIGPTHGVPLMIRAPSHSMAGTRSSRASWAGTDG